MKIYRYLMCLSNDQICRYQPDSTVLACYCSGAIYEYFEYGQVCTRWVGVKLREGSLAALM